MMKVETHQICMIPPFTICRQLIADGRLYGDHGSLWLETQAFRSRRPWHSGRASVVLWATYDTFETRGSAAAATVTLLNAASMALSFTDTFVESSVNETLYV